MSNQQFKQFTTKYINTLLTPQTQQQLHLEELQSICENLIHIKSLDIPIDYLPTFLPYINTHYNITSFQIDYLEHNLILITILE